MAASMTGKHLSSCYIRLKIAMLPSSSLQVFKTIKNERHISYSRIINRLKKCALTVLCICTLVFPTFQGNSVLLELLAHVFDDRSQIESQFRELHRVNCLEIFNRLWIKLSEVHIAPQPVDFSLREWVLIRHSEDRFVHIFLLLQTFLDPVCTSLLILLGIIELNSFV